MVANHDGATPARALNEQTGLRELRWSDLDEAVEDANALLAGGYTREGQWSLAQICQHLRAVQDPSIDGYPKWMSLFAFLRPAMRRWLLPKLFRDDPPRGIRTASVFVPDEGRDDTKEVAAFADSVARLKSHVGDYMPHPAFGRLPRDQILGIHAAHASHHLRFLIPRDSRTNLDVSSGNPQ